MQARQAHCLHVDLCSAGMLDFKLQSTAFCQQNMMGSKLRALQRFMRHCKCVLFLSACRLCKSHKSSRLHQGEEEDLTVRLLTSCLAGRFVLMGRSTAEKGIG